MAKRRGHQVDDVLEEQLLLFRGIVEARDAVRTAVDHLVPSVKALRSSWLAMQRALAKAGWELDKASGAVNLEDIVSAMELLLDEAAGIQGMRLPKAKAAPRTKSGKTRGRSKDQIYQLIITTLREAGYGPKATAEALRRVGMSKGATGGSVNSALRRARKEPDYAV